MIIDLPETFRLTGNSKSNYAEVKDNILHIYNAISFRVVMHNITYTLKGSNKCYYCGKTVKKKKITLDHMYAQTVGGPTIPNNLVPCCIECNSKKSNFSKEQFETFLSLSGNKKEEYRKIVENEQTLLKQNGLFGFPREWVKLTNIDKFIVRVDMNKKYKGKKYASIKAHYEEYHNLPKPVVVDKNGFLLDGYITLMFAKEQGIKKVPTIILENVIVHYN